MASNMNQILRQYAMDTVAFLFLVCSLASLVTSIVCSNVGNEIFEYYTSCHGDGTVEHDLFFFLVGIQVILIIGCSERLNEQLKQENPGSSRSRHGAAAMRITGNTSGKELFEDDNKPVVNTSSYAIDDNAGSNIADSSPSVVGCSPAGCTPSSSFSSFFPWPPSSCSTSSSSGLLQTIVSNSATTTFTFTSLSAVHLSSSVATVPPKQLLSASLNNSNAFMPPALPSPLPSLPSCNVENILDFEIENHPTPAAVGRRCDYTKIPRLQEGIIRNKRRTLDSYKSSKCRIMCTDSSSLPYLDLSDSRAHTESHLQPQEGSRRPIQNQISYTTQNLSSLPPISICKGDLPLIQIDRQTGENASDSTDADSGFDGTSKNEIYLIDNIPANNMVVRGICWNSLWMVLYYTIYILGFHASLLGWRIYGNNETNRETIKTCQHMNTKNFEDELPLIRSVISDFAYIETFISNSTAMLVARKYINPFFIKNYCNLNIIRECFLKRNRIKILQMLLQMFIYIIAGYKIILCWTNGYGTPMQIVSGLLLAFATLWVISVLTHVLQVDEANPRIITLEFHWLWSSISLFIIWLCGFLFYLSVYGIGWSNYLFSHMCCWIVFIILTLCKFHSIFSVTYNPELFNVLDGRQNRSVYFTGSDKSVMNRRNTLLKRDVYGRPFTDSTDDDAPNYGI